MDDLPEIQTLDQNPKLPNSVNQTPEPTYQEKRIRTKHENDLRKALLQECFDKNPHPSLPERRAILARIQTEIPNHKHFQLTSVTNWFMNTRKQRSSATVQGAAQPHLSPDNVRVLEALFNATPPSTINEALIAAWATAVQASPVTVRGWLAKQVQSQSLPTPTRSPFSSSPPPQQSAPKRELSPTVTSSQAPSPAECLVESPPQPRRRLRDLIRAIRAENLPSPPPMTSAAQFDLAFATSEQSLAKLMSYKDKSWPQRY